MVMSQKAHMLATTRWRLLLAFFRHCQSCHSALNNYLCLHFWICVMKGLFIYNVYLATVKQRIELELEVTETGTYTM